MEKLKVKIGKPMHHWVPIEVKAGDYDLPVDASSIPRDPLPDLILALHNAVAHGHGRVEFYLEPDLIYFDFNKVQEQFSFRITWVERGTSKRRDPLKFEMSGDIDQIIMPFWRALREFECHDYSAEHWPEFPSWKLQLLSERLGKKS